MNYTQNQKIEQVTESTLVLGVDIGSSEHYVRAFDYRGRELTRKVFRFSTDINGFNSFYDWVTQICIKHGKNEAMIGCEPTGHYWYTFYQFVKDHGMKLAFVNPASVKKAKELDDNSPKKTDLERSKDDCKACNRWKVQFSICAGRNLCRDQRSDIQPRSHHEGAECSIQQDTEMAEDIFSRISYCIQEI